MIPIVANGLVANAFQAAKTGFGLGALSDCISCHVVEERNGSFYLELEYPVGGNAWGQLIPGNLIRCVPSDGAEETLFRIDSVKPSLSGRVSVQAVHIYYDNRWRFVRPFSAAGLASAVTIINAADGSGAGAAVPLAISGDFSSGPPYKIECPRTVRDLMMGSKGSLVDVYGGEYKYTNFGTRATLCTARGVTRRQGIRYGKNMTSLEIEKALAEVYSGVYGYYYDSQAGRYVGANRVQSGPTLYGMITRYKLVDFTADFDTVPTAAQLDAKALSYAQANALGEPQVSIKVGFVPLHQTIEYADVSGIEHVQLCDTVPVVYERYGIELTAKVVKTDYDVLAERYRSVEVGTRRTTLPDFLRGVSEKTGVSVWT